MMKIPFFPSTNVNLLLLTFVIPSCIFPERLFTSPRENEPELGGFEVSVTCVTRTEIVMPVTTFTNKTKQTNPTMSCDYGNIYFAIVQNGGTTQETLVLSI